MRLIWLAGAGYFIFAGLRGIQHPRPSTLWFAPYYALAVAAFLIWCVVNNYWNEDATQWRDQPDEPLTRKQRIAFRVLGAPVALIGFAVFGSSCWFAWYELSKVGHWPYTTWPLLKGPFFLGLFGLFLFAGGIFVYRGPSSR